MSTLVTFHIKSKHVGIITLNRPHAANALSLQLLNQLNVILEQIEASDSLRCIIITGSGDRVFCAGADLKERRKMPTSDVIKTVTYIGRTISRIENLSIPVIAALNGSAFGGGLELSLACDIRIAVKDSKVGLPETSLAIIPGAGGTQRLPRLIGVGQANRLIYTAQPIDAKEALSLGVVELLVSKDELMHQAREISDQIAGNGPIAIKQAKRAMKKGIEVDLDNALNFEH